MASFDTIIKTVREMNTPYVKILDMRDNRLYDIDNGDSGVEETINKLQQIKPFLQGYGRVKLIAANPKQKAQTWKDAYKWELDFWNNPESQNLPAAQNFNVMPGMMSAREAQLLAENEKLKSDAIWNAKFAELEKKIDENNKGKEDSFMKYLPMAGMFVDIDQKKIDNVMKLAALGNTMNGGKQGIAGTEQKLTVEGTDEEKIKIVENLMIELSSKIPIDKIIILLRGLNVNPQFADQAIMFMSAK